MEWQDWPSVSFTDRSWLPSTSGIYVIADKNNFVWYVGQATDLRKRWLGRSHHRYPQLIRSNRKLGHRIYWTSCESNELNEKEKLYISKLKPELNDEKVKKYTPSQPRAISEIRRILRVFNRTDLLHPKFRSIILGTYLAEDLTQCHIIAIDNESMILYKSSRKKHAPSIRKAWSVAKPLCGRDETMYMPPEFFVFSFNETRLEFLILDDLMDFLRGKLEHSKGFMGCSKLFDVEMNYLKMLSLIDDSNLDEEYRYSIYVNRKRLTDFAYLKYRYNSLQSFVIAE